MINAINAATAASQISKIKRNQSAKTKNNNVSFQGGGRSGGSVFKQTIGVLLGGGGVAGLLSVPEMLKNAANDAWKSQDLFSLANMVEKASILSILAGVAIFFLNRGKKNKD